ncbi:MAG: SUF system Fe-S cluster assembly regulator [Coxiellaceae bacterium]|nr:SUF system Fe-S cluster assembly regulator [Coxiellaceae bacterium]
MFKISKLADYATVIMHWLSQHADARFSATVISEQTGIAAPTVSKILKLLNDAGLVTSTRGAQGGYHLSSPAEQISVAAIISAIDGRPKLTECGDHHDGCQLGPHCEIRGNWQYINKVVYKVLDNLSLQDMGGSVLEALGEQHVSNG